ncbi:uncharacterized protein [Atheta coriaria]|uniref:uncharacterized protein n=1 Tax=Dalotia coriaria TaxID=877792 RepID=UPI0031F3C25D
MQTHINQNSMENEKLTTELPQTGVIRELNKRFFHFGKKSEKKQHPGRIQSDKVKDKLFYEPQAQKYDKNKVQHYPPQNKKITPAFIGPQYTTSSSTRKFDNKQLSSLSNETTEQSDLSLFKELDDINQKLRDSINEVKSYHTMVYGNIHKPGHIVSKMVPPTMDYETTEKLSPRYFWDEDLDQKESPKMNKNYKSNSNAVDSEFRNRMTETDNCKPSCKSIHTQTTHGDPLLRVFANNNYPVQADEINNIAYHPKYKTYREYSTQSSNEYDFGPSFLTEKMDPFLNSDYSRLNQRNIANLMRMKARSKNVEPLEPKYDSIYNRVEPKGSYDLHNVSKISFHAMMPKQFPNKVLTTAMPFETLTNKGTHSNLIFVSEPQGRRGRQGRPQLWHFGAGVKNQPYLVEMKRENPSVDNFGGITNSAFTLVNKRPIIQNQLTSENMDLEDNVPIVYPRHYVLKPLAEDQPNDRINIERKSNDNSNDYISSPTGRLNNLNTNFNRRIGTNNVRVDDLNSKGSSCSPLQSPKMHSQVASYKISTMPYVIPESQIYNIPEPEPCNPPTPAIDDHDDLLACDDTTIPPVPSAGCEAEPITEYTPSIPVEITTCEPETTPMPFKCGTPDETDYDADEIKSSSCPPKSDNSYVQQQRIIHLQDQLTRLEAKDKFYEVERIQMQADAIKSLIPLKQMIVRLMEEIDLILKKIIDMEQFPQSPSVAEQCQSNQNHFNALVEGLTESQRTIKRIESTLEKIAENASDLKEENEIGLDEAKLRMSGISCRLDKEKRRIMDEQNKQLVAQQCKKQTKRRNKKFRLFRWKRMLQEAIDMLSK